MTQTEVAVRTIELGDVTFLVVGRKYFNVAEITSIEFEREAPMRTNLVTTICMLDGGTDLSQEEATALEEYLNEKVTNSYT